MGMDAIEREMLKELKTITGRKSLKIDDVQEWSTSEDQVRKNTLPDKEDVVHCPGLGVWCAVLKKA